MPLVLPSSWESFPDSGKAQTNSTQAQLHSPVHTRWVAVLLTTIVPIMKSSPPTLPPLPDKPSSGFLPSPISYYYYFFLISHALSLTIMMEISNRALSPPSDSTHTVIVDGINWLYDFGSSQPWREGWRTLQGLIQNGMVTKLKTAVCVLHLHSSLLRHDFKLNQLLLTSSSIRAIIEGSKNVYLKLHIYVLLHLQLFFLWRVTYILQ